MHRDFADPVAMLPLPRLDTRTEAQAGGADCVWCGARGVVPLGQRLSTCQGALVQWKPRACRLCTRREAGRVYTLHIGSCSRCTQLTYCPDARALYALSQPTSATSRLRPVTG